MNKFKLFAVSILCILAFSTNAKAEFFSDVIVTSANGIWTDARAYSTLNAAITAVGSNQRTVVIVGTQTVTNLTVPSNVTLKFERDGMITNTGQLTIQTKNIIAENRRIFTGPGNIDFASGTILQTGWFNNIESAFAVTTNDTVTLIVSKPQVVTASYSPGNNVSLQWDAPGNILTVNAGVIVSNIGQVTAGNYQLFAGAGNFRFRDGTNLNSSWFSNLRSIITWVSTNQVTLTLQGTLLVDLTDTIPTNLHIDVDSQRGMFSVSGGVTLTINSPISPGPYQWFSGAGTVVLPSVVAHYPEWYSSGTFTQATITSALSAIGTTNKVTLLLRPGNWVISTALTFPSNVTVKMPPGAYFSGAAVTAGTITGLTEASPEMFGINTTPGTTDMSAAIQAALSSMSGGKLILKENETYLLASQVTGHSNLEIVGNNATLISTTRFTSYLYFTGNDNIYIHDLKFDLGKPSIAVYASYPTYYNIGLYFSTTSNVTVERCVFSNLYTRGIFAYQCTGRFTIRDNKFTSPTQTQMLMMEHVAVQTFNGNFIVENNEFANAAPASSAVVPNAFTASGTQGSIHVERNKFDYFGRDNTGTHRLGVIDFYGNSQNVYVKDNVSTNTMAQFMRLSSTNGAEISGNVVSANASIESSAVFITVEGIIAYYPTGSYGNTGINIHHNNLSGYDGNQYGIAIYGYDWGVPSRSIKVHHNKLKNFANAIVGTGPVDGAEFSFNDVSGVGYNQVKWEYSSSMTETVGTQANGIYRNLSIVHNNIEIDDAGATATISVNLYDGATSFTGVVRNIDISSNVVHSGTAGTLCGVNLDINSVENYERVTVRNNVVQNYAKGFYLRDANELIVEGNQTISCTTPMDQSGNGSYNASGNKWSAGAYSGRQQLGGGGTATISTAEVLANDTIILTPVVSAGTPGMLSVGTITPGTSFVVNSSNAADSSTFYWKIDH